MRGLGNAGRFFTLRAHLLFASGDTPAVSIFMNMKGTNNYCPCRISARESTASRASQFYQGCPPSTFRYPSRLTSCTLHSRTFFQQLVDLVGGLVRKLNKEKFALLGEAGKGNRCFRAYDFIMLCCQSTRLRRVSATCTADSWSFWIQHLAPVLLEQLIPTECHKHFVQLSELVRECLEFELPRNRLDGLKKDWANWVRDFEK